MSIPVVVITAMRKNLFYSICSFTNGTIYNYCHKALVQQLKLLRNCNVVILDVYNITIEEDGINSIGFVSVTNYSEQLYINSTAEWIVSNGDGFTHPIHIHVISFQTIYTNVESIAGTSGFDQDNVDDNWHMDEDYYHACYFAGVIRFHPTAFGGTLVYHRHILHHEDEGVTDVNYLNGG